VRRPQPEGEEKQLIKNRTILKKKDPYLHWEKSARGENQGLTKVQKMNRLERKKSKLEKREGRSENIPYTEKHIAF